MNTGAADPRARLRTALGDEARYLEPLESLATVRLTPANAHLVL